MESVIVAIYEWVAWFGEAMGNVQKQGFFGGPSGRGELVAHLSPGGDTFAMTFHGEPCDG